jgi:predicted transcriptional regulator
MSKAIISITDWASSGKSLRTLAQRLDAGDRLPDADYHLNFTTPSQLFSEVTPKRLELLYHLKQNNPMTVYRLAKDTGRNYSNVHANVARLLELELVEKDDDRRVKVPWEDIEIHASLNMPAKRVA